MTDSTTQDLDSDNSGDEGSYDDISDLLDEDGAVQVAPNLMLAGSGTNGSIDIGWVILYKVIILFMLNNCSITTS